MNPTIPKKLLAKIDKFSLEDLEKLYFDLGDEYDESPVSMDQFLDAPEYLGNYFQGSLYQYWREHLKEIYPSPYYSEYFLVCLSGGIGRGKSTVAITCLAYELHKLLCLSQPQTHHGLIPTTKIVIAMFNATLGLASNVGMDQLQQMMVQSSWFSGWLELAKVIEKKGRGDRRRQDKSMFPKRIDVFIGSRIGHSLGRAVHCLPSEVRIPLLDGTTTCIKDICERVTSGETLYTYSFDIESDNMVPGKVVWGGKTGRKEIYRIELDNGESFRASDNHPILMRDKTYREVRDCKPGDQVMPFKLGNKGGYTSWKNPVTGLSTPVHRDVATWLGYKRSRGYHIHHQDFNPTNNNPGNLELLSNSEHAQAHWDDLSRDQRMSRLAPAHKEWLRLYYLQSPEELQNFAEYMGSLSKDWWKNKTPDDRMKHLQGAIKGLRDKYWGTEKHLSNCRKNIKNADWWRYSDGNRDHITRVSKEYHRNKTPEQKKRDVIKCFRTRILNNTYKAHGGIVSLQEFDYKKVKYQKHIIERYFESLGKFQEAYRSMNHKIVSITLDGYEDVYDITVENYHNFAIEAGIILSNSALIDESNFETISQQVYKNFNSLIRRMQSRFMNAEGTLPGKMFVVSSESDKGGALNKIVESYKDKGGVYICGGSLWEVKPSNYSGKTFPVFKGTDLKQPEIIDDISDYREEDYEFIIDIPVEHTDDFKVDINAALRDLAGISTGSTYRLMQLKDKLNKALQVTPIFPEIIKLDFDDQEDLLQNYCTSQSYFNNPFHSEAPRYIHIDTALSGDRLGFASTYVSNVATRETTNPITLEKLTASFPVMVTDFAFTIVPTPGKQIPFYKIRMFLQYLVSHKLFNIAKVTSDGFMQSSFQQDLKPMGFDTELLSVDRTSDAYLNLRSLIYDNRFSMPRIPLLKYELEDIELTPDSKKVDHTYGSGSYDPHSSYVEGPDIIVAKTSVGNGSKDLADAIAGSSYCAQKYFKDYIWLQSVDKLKEHNFTTNNNVTGSKDKGIMSMLYKKSGVNRR